MESSVAHNRVQVKIPEPGWIGEVLGTSIQDLEVMPMGAGRGFQSTTWKLRLKSNPPGSAPETVILKSETTNEEFNELTRLANSYEREVGVYKHLIPRLKNHQPVVYACEAQQPSWLLIEDLTHLRPGDQVVGLSSKETLDAVKKMAVLHAEFWMDPLLQQQEWLPAHNFWFAQPDRELIEPFFQSYGIRLGESVSKICRAVLEQGEAITAAISERPWTLIHGDLRADNLLFGGTFESPAATIIDWSWASRSMAAIDLAFLIGGSTPIPQRKGCLEKLLVTWHDELVSKGVGDYSLTDARRDLQLAALRALTTAVVVSSFDKKLDVNIRSSLLWDQAIQRHGAFVEELEAWQALPDQSLFRRL